MRRVWVWVGVLLSALLAGAPSYAASPVSFPEGSGFTADQQQAITRAVASAKRPLEVHVLTTLPASDHGSPRLRAYAAADRQPNADQLVWAGDAFPAFSGVGGGDVGCALTAVRGSSFEAHQQFVELVRIVASDSGCDAMEQMLADRWEQIGTDDSGLQITHEKPTTTTWVLRGIVIAFAAALLGALLFFRGRAMRSWWQRRRRTEALVQHASDAATRDATDQAHTDVLAFGEALDAVELRPGDRMSYWQLALDEYDEASRLVDRRHTTRDDRRVSALCAQGIRHLEQARGTAPL